MSSFLLHNLASPLPCYAAITAVDVTPDLRKAKVFFRLVGEDRHVKEGQELLERERPQFQKFVAREIQLKFCPVLRFEYGVAPHLDEVDQLFENLRRPKHDFGD
ncbi:MAG: ribosome-binding factor A [Bdellovibrionales bacterium]|nr:ribosome-binding factor A [Bdellovibrionales bacterium]